MADLIATARNATVVSENQYNTVGKPKGSLTPATMTAMIGIHKSDGSAIDKAPNVKLVEDKLAAIAADVTNPNQAAAQTALTNLQNGQAKLFNKNDCGGFGSIVAQCDSHIRDSHDIMLTQQNLAGTDFSSFGQGVKDMGSMGDRGLTNSFGDLKGAGAAINSTGGLFNGVEIKSLGTPGGIVEGLNNNKLGNATGLNKALKDQGVNLNDIHNPAYKDRIEGVLGNINDPAALNASAEQFGTDPFADLPTYSGSDSSLYQTPSFGGIPSSPSYSTSPGATSLSQNQAATSQLGVGGFDAGATGFGGGQLAQPGEGGGGIQSLKDLGDPTKTAPPADLKGLDFGGMGIESAAGATNPLSSIGTKLGDMGGGRMINASAAPGMFGGIKLAETPLNNDAHPDLNSMMTDSTLNTQLGNMIGISGYSTSSKLPTVRDMLGPVAGNDVIDKIAASGGEMSAEEIAEIEASVATSVGFADAAGIQATSGARTQNLAGSMGFATNLHTYGKDLSTNGTGGVLMSMANTSTKYGEGVKASLIEGNNNRIFAANGLPQPSTNPFEGLPTYVDDDGSLKTNSASKLLGG